MGGQTDHDYIVWKKKMAGEDVSVDLLRRQQTTPGANATNTTRTNRGNDSFAKFLARTNKPKKPEGGGGR